MVGCNFLVSLDERALLGFSFGRVMSGCAGSDHERGLGRPSLQPIDDRSGERLGLDVALLAQAVQLGKSLVEAGIFAV